MESTCDDRHLLPLDVLIEILVFLPVISLLRFKSVCKSWRALIESSLFIDLHINTLPPDNSYSSKFGTFIFQTSTMGRVVKTDTFMLSGVGGGGGGGEDEEEEVKLEDLHVYSPYNNKILIVGSCNGLICLHNNTRRDVSLWNPATRQFRLLPKSLTFTGIGDLDEDFVAFGYDVKTKDYKVVQINCFRPYMCGEGWLPIEEHTFRVQVYSLSTDSWRLLEGINTFPVHPYQASGNNQGVYLNGSYYFQGRYYVGIGFENDIECRRMILSFDFTKEIFTTMQYPDEYYTTLTCLGDKLAVFSKVRAIDDSGSITGFDSYDIWVLNEHDVKESWTKVHSIGPYFSEIPKGISNNGKFAFIATRDYSVINGAYVSNYKLQLFNLDTKEVKEDFRTSQMVTRTSVYKQSLVSVGGNGATTDRVIGGAM